MGLAGQGKAGWCVYVLYRNFVVVFAPFSRARLLLLFSAFAIVFDFVVPVCFHFVLVFRFVCFVVFVDGVVVTELDIDFLAYINVVVVVLVVVLIVVVVEYNVAVNVIVVVVVLCVWKGFSRSFYRRINLILCKTKKHRNTDTEKRRNKEKAKKRERKTR